MKIFLRLCAVALAAAVGLSFASCGNRASTGKLVVNGLDEFNGKWVVAEHSANGVSLLAAAHANGEGDTTGSKIANGSALLNVWEVTDDVELVNYSKNDGNGTFQVFIVNTEAFVLDGDEFHNSISAVGTVNVTFNNGVGSGNFVHAIN